MTTQEYILNKFKIKYDKGSKMPIEIPDIGRNGLGDLFHELDFKIGAEVGVFEGEFSEVLCKKNPNLELFCIDPWVPHKGYKDYTRKDTLDNAYAAARKKLSPFNCRIVRKYSMQVVREFPDNSLDFVYIDGDHDFQNVTNDIVEWSKKVKVGGIISGHDCVKYKESTDIHVYEVVHGITSAYRIRPWFLLAAKSVVDGIIGPEARTFMWVKQKSW